MMSRTNLAFMNINAWDPDHVVNWLKGLDDSLIQYHHLFLQAKIHGESLLMLTHGDLTRLGITKIGHQELILEGVELLVHLYHELDKESLQSICLQLECRCRNLHNEVYQHARTSGDNVRLPIHALTHLTQVLDCIKQAISWLDRAPFAGGEMYVSKRKEIIHLALELLHAPQIESIQVMKCQSEIVFICRQLWEICERMVQDTQDSLFIQPAILELATLRKKPDDELGMHIQYIQQAGTHVIGGIKPGSPADLCNKLEGGDEVVQVNYQTVLGWQLNKLVRVLKENQKEVILTVKKRPHHPNMLGAAALNKQRRNQQKLQQSTLPKALSKRSSRGMRPGLMDLLDPMPPGAATEPLLEPPSREVELLSVHTDHDNNGNDDEDEDDAPGAGINDEDVEDGEEQDTDNDNVFRSGSESPGFHMVQLPVFEETKQRRATVSGGSPVMQRPSIEDFSGRPKSYTITVSSPSSEGRSSGFPSIDGVSPNTENPGVLEMPHHDEDKASGSGSAGCKEQYVVVTPPTEPPRTSPKNHRAELTIQIGDNTPKRAQTIPQSSHERQERARSGSSASSSSSRSSPAHDEATLRPDSVAGSYTVNIIGGVPIKIPVKRESPPTQSPSSLLRKKTLKNLISGGNRRVSCKDLGCGECQGWLWKKREHGESSHLGSKWMKRWFVLKKQHLYFYKDPEKSVVAQGVIHLPGFKVSPAPEVKGKKYAFKAHHSGTTFYLASERQDDMAKWMNKLGLAAIIYDPKARIPLVTREGDAGLYSESEEESSTSSPVTTPLQGSREDITASITDLTEQRDELVEAVRRVPLDGRDLTNRRRSTLRGGIQHLNIDSAGVQTLEYGKKLSSLNRTLKAKEQELKEIESLLSSRVSPEKLHDVSEKLHIHHEGATDQDTSEDDEECAIEGAVGGASEA